MKSQLLRSLLVLSFVVLSIGCTITRKISPIAPGTAIQTIAIQKNPKVLMDEFHPELVSQIEQLGFNVESYDRVRPDTTPFNLVYTANWQWDMAMYLTYFQAIVMKDGKKIGEVEYDARNGSGRMDKFGGTADKIRPLLIDLFNEVDRQKAPPATIDPAPPSSLR